MSTIYEVFNSESPGVRVFVRRNVLQQVMKLLSGSQMFANIKEKTISADEVDEYISLIPVDKRTDYVNDVALMNARPDEKHPAYLLNKAIPQEQVTVIFETLMSGMATPQLILLKKMMDDPSDKFIESVKGFLIGLRLVNAINESTFLTLRFGIELHLESFMTAIDNVIDKRINKV